MFREMRRKKQQLPNEISERILETGLVGVLGVTGDEDYPYTVPLNYVYENGKIYFHCAKTGHKLDGIQRNNKVSFCVIERDEIAAEKFTSFFRSVIAFGKAKIVEDGVVKKHALMLLVRKYSPGLEVEGEKVIQKGWNNLNVVEIEMDHVTGKEAIELVNNKEF
ncbi:5-nitroimidazole antibiotic resistance protein [Ornatilinea apprima]|uniref:5-nitroimidazole antibiotic resistance protein n=1 Tax=Ornatilinea apprima TaxID=1134406 RepID=A0A0P6XY28_9CHLR|nr:pyridoxamine 5'-phosphate oxidase family protein [Ornatilinea apprima]KPL80997.1 5-nitroimidazole antibiotic resistance protein [Ornatilinea apprima]